MNDFVSTIVSIAGGLGLFLFGMKIMSESIQKASGDRLRKIISRATDNRFVGVIVGVTVTGVIQSSSATTVMLVSFVNAGLINLQQSIGVIFGANIGTTITGWIVAVFGFKVKIASFALPAVAVGFFFRFLKNEKLKYWGEVLLGFGILFLGLSFMSGAVRDLRGSEGVMNFMSSYSADTVFSSLIVILIGAGVTVLIQSSSATMAMTMTLAVNGLIDFPTSCALILGENIGTTITAYLASIGTSTNAKRCARAHFIFNTIGVIWVLIIFHKFFINIIDWIVPGNPYAPDIAERSIIIADHMAAFHTIFNLTNALIFLPFVNAIAWLATRIVPESKKAKAEEVYHLKYISTGFVSTPAINMNQARLEITRMTATVIEMFDMVMDVFENPGTKLGSVVENIQMKENLVDLLEKEISEFLVKLSQHNISSDESHEISSMLHRVNELERIGDHCESLLKHLRRKYDSKLEFSEIAVHDIEEISGRVREFLELIFESVSSKPSNILPKADVVENRIDELRNEAKKRHIKRLNKGLCDVNSGLLFIDMVNSFEKIGDHAYNIAEGISGIRYF